MFLQHLRHCLEGHLLTNLIQSEFDNSNGSIPTCGHQNLAFRIPGQI